MFKNDLLFWLFRQLQFPSRRRQRMDSLCLSTMKRRYRIVYMRPFYNKPTECFRYEAILQIVYRMFQVWGHSTNSLQDVSCMRPSYNKHILWNHWISWGPIFVDCGVFAYSWGCNFMEASVLIFSNKDDSF